LLVLRHFAYISFINSVRNILYLRIYTFSLLYGLIVYALALLFQYVDGKFSWFRMSTQFVHCRELLQSPRTCCFAPLASPFVLEFSHVMTLSLQASFARHFKTFSLPDVAQHGGFRAPSWSPSLRSFAWAVSPVTVTAPLANLAI